MSFKINISASSFSRMLGCSQNHIRALIHSGMVNSIKIGGSYKFFAEEANNYWSSKENGTEFTPIIFNKEMLFDLLKDSPNLITTQDFAEFFEVSNITALSIIKDIPHIFYANRGGYKIRKEIFIDYIIENQTINFSNSTLKINENSEE